MKLRMLAVLIVASMVAVAAGTAGQEKGKTDEDKIQGTWTFVSLERGGVEVTEDFVKEAKVIFTADKVKIQAQGKEQEHGYKLDPAKKPKQFDILLTAGGKEFVLKGIYELDGDTLKVCFAAPDEKRPTEFVTQGGSTEQLAVLKREKN